MKTLNDYIKESILDDENVLISKAVKDVQNPFYLLSTLYNGTKDLKKMKIK